MFDKDMMFLVVFGLRGLKHELEAQKALQCALQLKTSLHNDNIYRVSIGVTSVGHVLRKEYTVIGPTVNKAARLMMAYPDKVTCDKETFLRSKLDQEYFKLMEPKALKGIANPGPIYEFKKLGVGDEMPFKQHLNLTGVDRRYHAALACQFLDVEIFVISLVQRGALTVVTVPRSDALASGAEADIVQMAVLAEDYTFDDMTVDMAMDVNCRDLPLYAFCGYMKFQHSVFRKTTYELLTDRQKGLIEDSEELKRTRQQICAWSAETRVPGEMEPSIRENSLEFEVRAKVRGIQVKCTAKTREFLPSLRWNWTDVNVYRFFFLFIARL
ncbi:Uncharacterized protein OBRU01_20299 [Operophtera brumata]|uniref:Guanylate cyclase domain-containing protein n=1 Tax=Operophtera brumata TaxID=104452 RepID=A0A0L7KV26_OPEBR|nr:Uncharacterized protein OBRU01_20299 [Operophtera brumata]